jgi:hypothetical protein
MESIEQDLGSKQPSSSTTKDGMETGRIGRYFGCDRGSSHWRYHYHPSCTPRLSADEGSYGHDRKVKVEPGVTLREYLSHRPVALILDQGIAVPPEQVRSMESLLVFGSACTVSSAERVFPSDGRYSTAQPRCGWQSRRTLTHYPD